MANILLVRTLGFDAEEQAVAALLVGAGHNLTNIDTNDPIPTLNSFDLVVMTSTHDDQASFALASVPVVGLHATVSAGLGLSTGNNGGSGTTMEVTDAGHPIAVMAGLTAGTNTIYSSTSGFYRFQGLATGVDAIAYHFQQDRFPLIAAEQGAALHGDFNAPARRAAFGFNRGTLYTPLGEATLLACCDWAMNASGAPDETAPTLSNATATATGSTTASGSVDTDEAATVYAVITESATPPEDGEDIVDESVAGGVAYDSAVASEPDTVNFAFTGLDPATTYWMHVVATDAADNMSDIESSSSFQTDAPPDLAPVVTITSPAGNIAVSAGTVLYLEGEAIDDNDGDISEGIDWMSSNTDDGVAGSLGTGSYVIVDTTGWEEGARTITAAATDGASNIGTDSFTLTIGAAPEPTDNPYLLARAKAAALGGF